MAYWRRWSRRAVALVLAAAVFQPGTAVARGNPGSGGGSGGRPPSAGTESVGNNLSYPVVFSEGVGITGLSSAEATLPGVEPWQQTWTGLRVPSPDNPSLALGPDGTYDLDGTTYYLQGTKLSSWQASWLDGAGAGNWPVNVKWGDNVLGTLLPSSGGSTDWTTTATIHLEVSMTGTTAVTSEQGLKYFPTRALYGSGNSEVFGTTGEALDATGQSTGVYSDAAYLIITALSSKGGGPSETPVHVLTTWNRVDEGPSSDALVPEVNASGRVSYTYNWFAGRDDLAPGWYRLTFGIIDHRGSLVGTPPTLGNASIVGVQSPSLVEGETGAAVACGLPVTVTDDSGNEVALPISCGTDGYGSESSVDVQLIAGTTQTGGKGGGGSGGGGSGGGGGGGGSSHQGGQPATGRTVLPAMSSDAAVAAPEVSRSTASSNAAATSSNAAPTSSGAFTPSSGVEARELPDRPAPITTPTEPAPIVALPDEVLPSSPGLGAGAHPADTCDDNVPENSDGRVGRSPRSARNLVSDIS